LDLRLPPLYHPTHHPGTFFLLYIQVFLIFSSVTVVNNEIESYGERYHYGDMNARKIFKKL
jgi:hypothetical protein